MPYAPFIFALFVIGIVRFAKWRKAIFKLKFSSINLLMTIAVVAAFIWENTGSSSCNVLF
jgi:Cd2+/Zn2+-exporting ATPase